MSATVREWNQSARETAYEAAEAVMNNKGGEPRLNAARRLLNATGSLRWDRSEGEENQLIGHGENGEAPCRMRRAKAVEGRYRRAHRAVRWAREGSGCTSTCNTVQWLGPIWVATIGMATHEVRSTHVTEIACTDEAGNHVGLAEGLWREDVKRARTHDITILGPYFASFARQVARGCARDGREAPNVDAADAVTVCICTWLHRLERNTGPSGKMSCLGDAPAVLNEREYEHVSEILTRRGHGLEAMHAVEQELARMDGSRIMQALRGWGEEQTSVEELLGATWDEAGARTEVAHKAVAVLKDRIRRLDG